MVVSLAKKGFDVVFTYHSNVVEAAKVVSEVQQLGQKAASISLDTSKANTLDAFKDNLENDINNQAKELTGADLIIESRRALAPATLKSIENLGDERASDFAD